MIDIKQLMSTNGYWCDPDGIYRIGRRGYWSTLSKEENERFVSLLECNSPLEVVEEVIPFSKDMIFSEKREAALELLDHSTSGVCIDYGCMWGVMSIGMAKRGHTVVAIDQTNESLLFLRHRSESEGLGNIHVVQDDLRELSFREIANYALVNGVLEWIPIAGEVYIKDYFKKMQINNSLDDDPRSMQARFLEKVYSSLVPDGQMMLAIECRNNYEYFLGKRDPHVNLLFTTFLPRFLADAISRFFSGKPYRNYIYSFTETRKLVVEAGFRDVKVYAAFPDYHFPELILPFTKAGFDQYENYSNPRRITFKQKLAYYIELFLMKVLKFKSVSPAIIIVATK